MVIKLHKCKGTTHFFFRNLTELVLTTYIANGLSLKNPLQCLDLSTDREESSKWKNKHGLSIICVNGKSKENQFDEDKKYVTITNSESNYTVIEKSDFNFL